MHPRNIFKDGVKFEELAKKYDFFKPFLIEEKPNKFIIDFDDKEAVAALNRTLLLEYFNLKVNIPTNFLIPRIPLRVNYILWIEDLLEEFSQCFKTGHIRGLDIGTGPSAVYALLGEKMNGWEMHGTDINEQSVGLAQENVKKNDLEDKVKIHHVTGESYFAEVSEKTSLKFDFSMCNPPFFSDSKDPLVRLDSSKASSWEVKSEVADEIICPGGEVSFVFKMFEESKKHQVVRIFTTMVGVKKHLTTVIKQMKEMKFENYTTCIFHQGRTSRWGLAWSWDPAIKFTQHLEKPKKNALYEARFAKIQSLQSFILQLEDIFRSLKLKVEKVQPNTYYVEARENTWSHSRRKRRMEKLEALDKQTSDHNQALAPEENDNGESPLPKVPRINQEESAVPTETKSVLPPTKDTPNPERLNPKPLTDPPDILIAFKLSVSREGEDVLLNQEFKGGKLGKDGAHQILQYLKNNQFT